MRSLALRNQPHRERRGVTLPFIVLLLATFIGMAAFAIDISRMYIIHGQLQTAAEAGALAATNRMLNGDARSATDSALAYVRRNPTDSGGPPDVAASDVVFGHWESGAFTPTSGWSDPNSNAAQVTAHHTGRYFFAPIYQIGSTSLNAQAIAAIGSVSAATCIRPLAIPYSMLLSVLYPTNTPPVSYMLSAEDITRLAALTRTNAILLKIGDASQAVVSGNFYAVREGSVRYADGSAGNPWSGGSNYSSALSAANCSTLPYLISIGDWLQAEQGNMVGPTRSGLAGNPLCNAAGNSYTCQRDVPYLVAIWDSSDKKVSAPNAFRVKYLGVFKATGYLKGSGNAADGILGYFSTMSVNGEYTDEPGPATKAVLRR